MFQSRRLRESILLVLGVITPLGILAVNISAFVMAHLAEFRIGIAALALLSGLVLNGLTAWWLLRLASRSAAPLFAEYRRWAIGAAVLIVAGVGALCAYTERYLTATVGQRVMHDLRQTLYSHIQQLSLNYHDRTRTGDLIGSLFQESRGLRYSRLRRLRRGRGHSRLGGFGTHSRWFWSGLRRAGDCE